MTIISPASLETSGQSRFYITSRDVRYMYSARRNMEVRDLKSECCTRCVNENPI